PPPVGAGRAGAEEARVGVAVDADLVVALRGVVFVHSRLRDGLAVGRGDVVAAGRLVGAGRCRGCGRGGRCGAGRNRGGGESDRRGGGDGRRSQGTAV